MTIAKIVTITERIVLDKINIKNGAEKEMEGN